MGKHNSKMKKAWLQHKLIVILLCIYFALFTLFNVKQGIVVTPIMQYGMFSHIQNLSDTQKVYEFIINNKKISLNNFSFTERDIILTPLIAYVNHSKNNDDVFKSYSAVVAKCKINTDTYKANYYNKINDTLFTSWYKNKLSPIIKMKINTLEIYTQKYIWRNNALVKTDTAYKIKAIVN